ncbi:hypothetical protein OIO90_002668 [Microbotryomycetes sp. JL221]|nr:hypothetical protein OIO90_002668 [Microbotryomycetes sp. JL221]
MTTHEVIIVGSGISALAAARVLKAHRPLLLEARRDRVGGRAHTTFVGDNAVDLGCSMIHGYNEGNPLKWLSRQLELPPAHVVQSSRTMIVGPNGPLSSDETARLLKTSSDKSFKPSQASKAPTSNESLADVTMTLLAGDKYEKELQALARLTEIGAGVKLEQISAEWTGFARPFGGTDGFPDGGYKTILEQLVNEVKDEGGDVCLGQQVVEVRDDPEARVVEVKTADGTAYTARFVVSTIPLAVLQRRPPKFVPSLPPATLAAIARTKVGVLEKALLAYDEAWWPDADTHGQFIILPDDNIAYQSQEGSLLRQVASTILNVSSFQRIAKQPHSTLLVYLGAQLGEAVSRFSKEEVLDTLHEYLCRKLGQGKRETSHLDRSRSTVTTWLTDEFSLGATSSPVTLQQSSDGVRCSPLDFVTLSRSHFDGRLGFAGEHTSLDHRGSAAGAWVSGVREGERVLDLLANLRDSANDAKL